MRGIGFSGKKFKTNYNRVLRRKDKMNLRNAGDDFSCLEGDDFFCLEGNEIRKHYDLWNID